MTDIAKLPAKISSLRAGAAALLPIYPESFEDVVRLARMACMGGMVKPQTFGYGEDRRTEGADEVEARATMIIMQGMEVGLPPMQAIQLIAMINGRMTIHSEGVPAVLLSKGFAIRQEFAGVPFEDGYHAICTLTRPDGASITSTFSVADAKKSGLWSPDAKIKKRGKNNTWYDADNDSAWHRYPKRMLWARALGFASKDHAADAMRGLMVREEVEDMILRSERAIDVTPADTPKDVGQTGRRGLPPVVGAADVPDVPEPAKAEPDVPEMPAEPAQDRFSPDEEARLISQLQEEMDEAETDAIRREVEANYVDLLDRMSDAGRRKAEAIMEGRA